MLSTPSPASFVSSALRLLANGGIGSISAVIVLLTLREEGDTTISALAARVGCSSANLTGLIDRLERPGLIRRHREGPDRRSIYIQLLTPGTDLLERAGL